MRFLTIEKCSRELVELDRASTRGVITPPTPQTLLNVQGVSGFSKKLGSVGGVDGAAWAHRASNNNSLHLAGLRKPGKIPEFPVRRERGHSALIEMVLRRRFTLSSLSAR